MSAYMIFCSLPLLGMIVLVLVNLIKQKRNDYSLLKKSHIIGDISMFSIKHNHSSSNFCRPPTHAYIPKQTIKATHKQQENTQLKQIYRKNQNLKFYLEGCQAGMKHINKLNKTYEGYTGHQQIAIASKKFIKNEQLKLPKISKKSNKTTIPSFHRTELPIIFESVVY